MKAEESISGKLCDLLFRDKSEKKHQDRCLQFVTPPNDFNAENFRASESKGEDTTKHS